VAVNDIVPVVAEEFEETLASASPDLLRHKPGTLAGMAEHLYQRSAGMIGSLSQLIRGAAILAIEDGTEKISREHLDLVPVDYAAQTAYASSAPRRRQSNRRVPVEAG
jgi:hypothetical protein